MLFPCFKIEYAVKHAEMMNYSAGITHTNMLKKYLYILKINFKLGIVYYTNIASTL